MQQKYLNESHLVHRADIMLDLRYQTSEHSKGMGGMIDEVRGSNNKQRQERYHKASTRGFDKT